MMLWQMLWQSSSHELWHILRALGLAAALIVAREHFSQFRHVLQVRIASGQNLPKWLLSTLHCDEAELLWCACAGIEVEGQLTLMRSGQLG